MTTHGTASRMIRPLLWLGAGLAANLALPWLFSQAAKHAKIQDFTDCDESETGQPVTTRRTR